MKNYTLKLKKEKGRVFTNITKSKLCDSMSALITPIKDSIPYADYFEPAFVNITDNSDPVNDDVIVMYEKPFTD